jgi:hypothetical protein
MEDGAGDMSEPERMLVIKAASTWVTQAQAAMAVLTEKNGGREPDHIADLAKVDYGAFCLLIEAMYALTPITGRPVSKELMELAQLKPVDEIMRDADG